MKPGFLFRLSVIVSALFAAGLQISAAAGFVAPADRLSIPQPHVSAVWKGQDLTVNYTYSAEQGQMELSGNIRFSDSMSMGFALLHDFRLSVIFLDQNGRVLEQKVLATNRGGFDPIPFKTRLTLPPGAVSMAFSYQGQAVDSASGGGGGGFNSFWYSPVH